MSALFEKSYKNTRTKKRRYLWYLLFFVCGAELERAPEQSEGKKGHFLGSWDNSAALRRIQSNVDEF